MKGFLQASPVMKCFLQASPVGGCLCVGVCGYGRVCVCLCDLVATLRHLHNDVLLTSKFCGCVVCVCVGGWVGE
jgi:hypothetical protein